jgi:FkbM family methyltransferase
MLNFFQSTGLRPLFDAVAPVAIDIGSRGGIDRDLEPIAWSVSAWGFEPDPDALRRLEQAGRGPWRELHHLPTAIGGGTALRTLHVPRSPEGASLLEHNPAMKRDFAYGDLFEVERVFEVSTVGLDEAIAKYGIPAPSFIKLDVEGVELEILRAAPAALESAVAIKTEASFLPHRLGQPLAAEVATFLLERGFVLMDFAGVHRWRRYSTIPAPYVSRDRPIAFSAGQLCQGDFLFFRDPDRLVGADDRTMQQTLRSAAIALCYGFFDHAYALLRREPVAQRLSEAHSLDALGEIPRASRRYGRRVALRAARARIRDLIPLTRSVLRTFAR